MGQQTGMTETMYVTSEVSLLLLKNLLLCRRPDVVISYFPRESWGVSVSSNGHGVAFTMSK